MNKKFIALAVLAISTLAAPAAYAAKPATPQPPAIQTGADFLDGEFTFAGANGDVTVSYSGATPVGVAVGENWLHDQDYTTVGEGVKSLFGITSFNSGAYQVDTAASIMTGNVASFVSPVAYNYLAIHFGRHQMFFDFGAAGIAAGSAFNISTDGQAAGLSNFRAYSNIVDSSVTPPVPVPATFWLFGSGLLGLVGFRKRSV